MAATKKNEWVSQAAVPIFTERMREANTTRMGEANRKGGVMDGKAKELRDKLAKLIEQAEAGSSSSRLSSVP